MKRFFDSPNETTGQALLYTINNMFGTYSESNESFSLSRGSLSRPHPNNSSFTRFLKSSSFYPTTPKDKFGKIVSLLSLNVIPEMRSEEEEEEEEKRKGTFLNFKKSLPLTSPRKLRDKSRSLNPISNSKNKQSTIYPSRIFSKGPDRPGSHNLNKSYQMPDRRIILSPKYFLAVPPKKDHSLKI